MATSRQPLDTLLGRYCSHMETRSARLRRLRMAKKMSLQAVGDVVGVEKATVSKWENHKAGTPEIDLAVFFKLADLYNIDARELATGKPSARPALPPQRHALITAYGALRPEVRAPIRQLIETLATASNPSYAAWSAAEQKRAKARDEIT